MLYWFQYKKTIPAGLTTRQQIARKARHQMNTPKTTATRQITDAVVFLADRCDGARTLDRQGFNGRDTEFGKSLARQIRDGKDLTEKQIRAARKMLVTYQHSQLEPAGLSLPTSDALDQELTGKKRPDAFEMTDAPDKNAIIVRWSRAQKDTFLPVLKREVPPRFCKFNPADSTWTVDASYKRTLKRALRRASAA
jgi:hypothetical protein